MSLAQDMRAYLQAQSIAGTISEAFVPATTPGRLIAVIPYGGEPPIHSNDGPDARIDQQRFQVEVRDTNPTAAEEASQQIQNLLLRIINITVNGTWYLRVDALQPPFRLTRDELERTVYVANYRAEKAPALLEVGS